MGVHSLPYSWSRSRPARLNSVSVLRRSFGTTFAARAGDRSHRRLPGSRVAPALRRIPSRSDGQRIATRAPSSTSWHGPIWCGRSTISTPDEFRRQPVGAEETKRRPASYASLPGHSIAVTPPYPVRLGRNPIAIAMMASIVTTRMAAANTSTSFGMAQFPRILVPWSSVRPTASTASSKPCG